MYSRRLAIMTPDDLESVLAMERICFRHPWSHEAFVSELACEQARNYTVRQLDQGVETLVGYSCFRIILNEMHLMKIAVHPKHRNQGIGAWLMHSMIELSKIMGATTAFLEVRSTNSPAVSLYRKHGFETIHTRHAYYIETHEDAFIMNKNYKEVVT